MQRQEESRYTSALPSNTEVLENPALLLSDHAPILFNAHGINGISWNVLDPECPSGYDLIETVEQIGLRRARIIASLKQLITANPSVDMILLQEADWLGKKIFTIFKDQEWYDAGSANGNILLFNMKNNIANVGGVSSLNSKLFGTVSRVAFDLKNDKNDDKVKSVKVLNVQGMHIDLPLEHQAEIRRLLALDDLVIVAGDFNVRIAPTHNKLQNIITGLVPSKFRHITGPCNWTDGAFYGGKELAPKQCSLTILDPVNGSPAVVSPVKFDSAEQRAQISRQWPCISIGGSPYAKLQDQLRVLLSTEGEYKLNPNVHIFSSTSAMNDKGVVIAYTDEHREFFVNLSKEIEGINFSFLDGTYRPVYLALMSAATFVEVEEWLFRQKNAMLQGRFMKPAVELRTAPLNMPLCYLSRLTQLQIMLSACNEDGASVAACRGIKEELQILMSSANPLTAFFSKIMLANYLLRFSEYSTEEFALIKNDERQLPECIIRPTHLSMSINLCVEMLDAITPAFLESLNDRVKNLLLMNLQQVCENVCAIVRFTRNDFPTMARFYDKANRTQASEKSTILYNKQATEILKSYMAFKEKFDQLYNVFPQLDQPNDLFIQALNLKSLYSPGCQVM